MKAYRVEKQDTGNGIWRNFDGTINPIFTKLSDGKARNLPMPDNDFYRFDGKQWFAACDEKEKLTNWFSLQDVLEMLALGYEVWEFEITDCRTVSEYEIVFTRESIVWQRPILYSEIWKEEKIDQMQREADRTGYSILSIMTPTPDYDSSLNLAPCPFCGCKEVVYEEYKHSAGVRWRVVCFGCMASVDPGYAQERHVVAQMWNRRVKNEDA